MQTAVRAKLPTPEEIVRHTADLPALPEAAMRVMHQADDPNASASGIARTLSHDTALSARVLRLANSAFFGLERRVANLTEAVVVLGLRHVRNLSLVAATYPWLNRSLAGYGLGPKQMWNHAFGTALGAKLIAQRKRSADPEVAFTAGLLHDIGKAVLSMWLEDRLPALLTYAARKDLTFDEAERELFGFDHAEVGALLGERWNLPGVIVTVIRHHHHPDTCDPHEPLADCVHVGNYLAMSLGFGLGGDGLRYQVSFAALDRLGLAAEDLDQVADDFTRQYQSYESLFAEVTK